MQFKLWNRKLKLSFFSFYIPRSKRASVQYYKMTDLLMRNLAE